MKRKLSIINLSSENNLSMFRLNVPVDWNIGAFSWNVGKLFSLHSCGSQLRSWNNRPFSLTSKYVQNTWRHAWGALEGMLGRILHCYIQERSLRSDECCLRVQGNPKLPRRRPGVPVWTYLVCTQWFVVATKCLHRKFWLSITYSGVHQPKVSVIQFWPM